MPQAIGLTFSTTSLPLARAIRDKKLLVRNPLRPLVPITEERHLLVTPEIDAMLDEHLLFGIFPAGDAEGLVGRFSAGYLLTVLRRMPKKKERPDLEQLVGYHEVWSVCVRRPEPGWRLLGRWYDKNVLVALRAWDKHMLARHYDEAAAELVEDWKILFGDQAAHSADETTEYIGGVINDWT